MKDFLNRFGARILTALAALVPLLVLYFMFGGLKDLSPKNVASLPLVAIGGVVVLVLLLAAVATLFSVLGLTDEKQALGLPEGSIRAVIALSLIVLFAILSIFLYNGVSEVKVNVIAGLSNAERLQFIQDHPNLPDLQSVISKGADGKDIVERDDKGNPIVVDGIQKYRYDITYSGSAASAASQDFAKQLLVLLGTLMTAITSFYLGANTVSSANKVRQTEQASTTAPTITDFAPREFSKSSTEPLLIKIAGSNLNTIVNARLTKGNSSIPAKVESSANSVTCTFDANEIKEAEPGDWTVVIDDGGSNIIKASPTLKLTA